MCKPDPALKGELNGNCNREACQKPGALWFNRDTEKYYCTTCARLINRANAHDSMRIYGSPDLCVLVEAENGQS